MFGPEVPQASPVKVAPTGRMTMRPTIDSALTFPSTSEDHDRHPRLFFGLIDHTKDSKISSTPST
jgi:hypothetical protein